MIVIANWKMNLGIDESVQAARRLVNLMAGYEGSARAVVCPSFVAMKAVSEEISGTKIALGSQDAFWETRGAFTGDVSPSDVHELGCRYILLGHSERRRYHHETNEEIQKKVRLVVRSGMNPVLCVGETGDERRTGRTQLAVVKQLRECLSEVKLLTSTELVVAYEPVWAIGTGTPERAEDIEFAGSVIGRELADMGFQRRRFSILYGGSVSEREVATCVSAGCQGLLVGGQSKDPEAFFRIMQAVADIARD